MPKIHHSVILFNLLKIVYLYVTYNIWKINAIKMFKFFIMFVLKKYCDTVRLFVCNFNVCLCFFVEYD